MVINNCLIYWLPLCSLEFIQCTSYAI